MEIELLNKPSTALTIPERAAIALGSKQSRLDLAAMVLKSVNVKEIKNKAGRDECHSYAMALADARIAIAKNGKAKREDATKFSTAVIAEANSLIAIASPEELRLLALRDAWDKKLADERAAKEQAERERINSIHQRIADIRGYHALALECRTADMVQTLIDKLADIEMIGFEEFEDEAKASRVTTMDAMYKLFDQKRAAEAETARVQAEQAAAAAQLVKERAEMAAQQAAARLEQKRIDDEAKARREAEQAVIDERNAKAAAELATAREALAAQAKTLADAQAVIDEVARKAKEAEDLAAYQAAVVPVIEVLPSGQRYSTTTFKDNGEPILLNADGTRSIFCDLCDDMDPPYARVIEPPRPTDRAMLGALALHFKVTAREAFDWLYTVDFDGLSDALIDEVSQGEKE